MIIFKQLMSMNYCRIRKSVAISNICLVALLKISIVAYQLMNDWTISPVTC